MNRFRKALSVILCTALLLSFLPAQADTYWNMYWKSGDHTVEFTAEDEAWKITPVCYDYEESDFPITAWEVAVYAHDGSICGYREVNGAG